MYASVNEMITFQITHLYIPKLKKKKKKEKIWDLEFQMDPMLHTTSFFLFAKAVMCNFSV